MKDEKIKVTKIEIKVGKKVLSLTPDEGRELCTQLKELFGNNNSVLQPIYIDRHWWERPYWSYETKVYCGQTTGVATWESTDLKLEVWGELIA